MPGATPFGQKCQRIDAAGFDYVPAAQAEWIHEYGEKETIRKKRWWSARAPLELPEAVEDFWFESGGQAILPVDGTGKIACPPYTVASFARPKLKNVIEQTLSRIQRTREDVKWLAFERPPTVAEMASVAVWVDPASDPLDLDGFVAEALVAGKICVASRTPVNAERLESGRTGLLVPPADPNELAHAILAALFKPEVAQQKIDAARQTRSKFRSRQRHRALAQIYESL